jgi:hypothetical protein
MLSQLSAKHRKKISFCLMYLFLFSGLASLEVRGQYMYSGYAYNYNNYNSESHHRSNIYSNTDSKPSIYSNATITHPKHGTIDKKNIKTGTTLGGIVFTDTTGAVKNIKFPSFKHPTIGGPSQPEMSKFMPVGADNMVNPFTGKFSYNIPLLDVGGYGVNMFYNSGITMDQDASWVGLGWDINPGTISRNMRGIPDDFDGTDTITKRQSIRTDKTWGVHWVQALNL